MKFDDEQFVALFNELQARGDKTKLMQDGLRRLLTTIVRPCQVTGEYVFWALQELCSATRCFVRRFVLQFN